jgi:protocatechuate 3,4-dioxygenase beta subunit
MRTAALLLVALSVIAADGGAQTRPAATATRILRGVVVRALDDSPLGRARVVVTRAGTQITTASVMTDGRGAFAMTVPAQTAFDVRVQKAGYAVTRVPIGAARAGLPTELRVSMAKGAVVTGRVLLDNGARIQSGITILRIARLGATANPSDRGEREVSVRVNERGEYRVSGLTAGRYSIAPLGSNAFAIGLRMPPTVVDVAEGAEVSGADVLIENMRPVALPVVALHNTNPIPGGAVIRGRVTGTSGEPLAVSVTVASAAAPGVLGSRRISATSDADGRYAISGIPAGTFTVESTTVGYVTARHGSRDAQLPGLSITVKANDEIDGIDLVMARTSAVSGTVVDEAGDPVEGANVQLLRLAAQARGQINLPTAADPFLTSTSATDDLGRFRLASVSPGQYLIAATIPDETGRLEGGPRLAYVPSYYPGTPDYAAAARVTVGIEQDLSGFTIPIGRTTVARVEGIAVDSGGRPLTGQIRLSRVRTPGIAQQPRQNLAGPAGEFVFNNVQPGEYVVHATTSSAASGPEFAAVPITVAEIDPPPVRLRSSPASRVSGRIVLEGPPDAVLWGYSSRVLPLDLALSATGSATTSGALSSGETFLLSGLAGHVRMIFSTPDEKWFLKAIVVDGADIADRPFEFGVGGRAFTDVEVVFSAAGASVAGRVTDERGEPVANHAVIVFAAGRDRWFHGSRWLKMARGQSDGSFKVAALPPGEYLVAAVDRVDESADWQDPEFLQEIASGATRVTLGERQAGTAALRIVRR